MKTNSYLFTGLLAVATAMPMAAAADAITFTGSGTGPGSVPVSASAIFDISGNTLTITLRNTSVSNNGQDVPGSTLTGLLWDFTGNPLLTPVSATVAPGSSIIQANTCTTGLCAGATNVGGEFGYQGSSLGFGSDRGISSSGYLSTGLPGNLGNFNGTNLDNPNSLDGINFGIVSSSSGFNPNGGLSNDPLVQDAVVFILSGVNGLSINDISHVSFQYGTSLTELNIPGDPTPMPEPTILSLLGLGLLGFSVIRKQKT
ncbi:MAG: PEP-CTERM sorting domain-containing protein [Nitrosomonas sp.]|nr:PEP-CTERM sorting domain-containing protein [Nitrosomonas sp.]